MRPYLVELSIFEAMDIINIQVNKVHAAYFYGLLMHAFSSFYHHHAS